MQKSTAAMWVLLIMFFLMGIGGGMLSVYAFYFMPPRVGIPTFLYGILNAGTSWSLAFFLGAHMWIEWMDRKRYDPYY